MTVAKDIVAGAGTRYGVTFPLGTDGLPNVTVASATLIQGTLIQGIKSANIDDPDPRPVNHVGNDGVLAADSLPPTSVGAVTVDTAATNLALDALFEGNKVRTLGNTKWRAVNSDKAGNEAQVLMAFYRQAIDVDPTSATYGKLRQWHGALFPSIRVSPKSQPFGEAETNKSYNGIPTPVKDTPWGESLDETDWGASRAEYLEFTMNYHPRFNAGLGNGTLVSFVLSHPPFSSAELLVFNCTTGAVLTPTGVTTTSANPSFTLGAAVADGTKLFVVIGTNEPGES